MLKATIAQAAVSSHLLEDQLHLIPARVPNIKSQVAKHEITISFLEPSGFEIVSARNCSRLQEEQANTISKIK